MTETTLTHAFSVNYFSSNLGRLRSTRELDYCSSLFAAWLKLLPSTFQASVLSAQAW